MLIVAGLSLAQIAPPTAWGDSAAEQSQQGPERYEPLTREEADAWLHSITYDELLDFVIRYDYVEHATPEFDSPGYLALVVDDDLRVEPDGRARLRIGHLEYRLRLPDMRFPDIVPEPPDCGVLQWASGGFAVGLVAGVLSTAFVLTR